ncbi:hypothetical protein V6N13_101094 [Hibiscus sabdariffa]
MQSWCALESKGRYFVRVESEQGSRQLLRLTHGLSTRFFVRSLSLVGAECFTATEGDCKSSMQILTIG